MSIRRFEEIEGWQLARELTKRVYAVAMRGAFAKDFGLWDQFTRAAGSVSQDEFDSIYEQAAKTHSKVGGFIRYLLSNPNPS